ncbi:MAG TPA: nuclear transport factor 2 family protein [Anaerolineales bacterium]
MPFDPQSISETDRMAIHQAALDYIEGWYSGNAEQMERSLHPDLAKRIVFRDPRGFDRLEPISALGLVIATRRGVGRKTPLEDQRKEITFLDVFGNTACIRVDAADWVDFLQMGKLNGQWQIVNVLWERRQP